MSNDKIAKIHKVVKEPLRQKILVQLGSHKSLTFKNLIERLKIEKSKELELSKQLEYLEKVTLEKEHLIIKQTDSYQLTERGRYVLEKMVTYPQLETSSFKKLFRDIIKPKPKWFTPHLAVMTLTIILGVLVAATHDIPLNVTVLLVVLALVAEDIAHYVRFLPFLSRNRVRYILMGVPIGGILWLAFTAVYIGTGSWSNDEDLIFAFGILIACLGIGTLIGDSIGRLRDYKGPKHQI